MSLVGLERVSSLTGGHDCCWQSSQHHGTRWCHPLQRCCPETKLFLSSHFTHLIISYFSHFCFLEKQLFSTHHEPDFLSLHLQNKTTKKLQKNKNNTKRWTVEESCRNQGFAELGVNFLFLENIIYFCAILFNVFVDCFFCLFFFKTVLYAVKTKWRTFSEEQV